MKLILIGFMGAGKSAIAMHLGSLLKLPVVEMDALVLKKTNSKDMQEVFAKGGELLLRETEIAIAREYADIEHSLIVSTGAGVVSNRIVLDYLKSRHGKIFFLNATFPTIAARLSQDVSRPLFQNIEQARSLYNFRHPLYLEYADYRIDVDYFTLEQIAQNIVEIVKGTS